MIRAFLKKSNSEVKDIIYLVLEEENGGRYSLVDMFDLTNQEEVNRLEITSELYAEREKNEDLVFFSGEHGRYKDYHFIWIDADSGMFFVDLRKE